MPKEIYFNNCKYIVGKNANENWNILGDAEYGDIWIHLHNKPSCYVILQSKYVISEEHITYGCLLCKQNSKYIQDRRLSYSQLFYLATQGGANTVGLGDKIGNFGIGKDLDALIVNPMIRSSIMTVYEHDHLLDQFQKFLFLGDDRNISQVIVKGKKCRTD